MANDLPADETTADLQAQITALKGLVVAILGGLANRDIGLAREIVKSVDIFPGGIGNVAMINPRFQAVKVALDDILHDLRSALDGE